MVSNLHEQPVEDDEDLNDHPESTPLFFVRPFLHSPDSPSARWDDTAWYGRLEEFVLSASLTNMSNIDLGDQEAEPLPASERGILMLSLEGMFQWFLSFKVEEKEMKLANSRLIFMHPTLHSVQIDWTADSLSVSEWAPDSGSRMLKSSTTSRYATAFFGFSWTFDPRQACVAVRSPSSVAASLGASLDGYLAPTLFATGTLRPAHLQNTIPSPLNFIQTLPSSGHSVAVDRADAVATLLSNQGAPRVYCAASNMVFVTAASAQWFLPLQNLVGSIHMWQPQQQQIFVYDLGLTEAQISQVRTWHGVTLYQYTRDCLENRSLAAKFTALGGLELDPTVLGDLSSSFFKPLAMFHALSELHQHACVTWIDAGLELRQKFLVPSLYQQEGFFFVAEVPLEQQHPFLSSDPHRKSYRLPESPSFSYPKLLFDLYNISDPTRLAPAQFSPVSASLFGISRASPAFEGVLIPWINAALCHSHRFLAKHGYSQKNILLGQSFLNMQLYAPTSGFIHSFLKHRQLAQAGVLSSDLPPTDIHNFIHSTLQYSVPPVISSCFEALTPPPHYPLAEPSDCPHLLGAKKIWGSSHPIIIFPRRFHPFKPFLNYIRLSSQQHQQKQNQQQNQQNQQQNQKLNLEDHVAKKPMQMWNGAHISTKPPMYNLTICAVFRDEASYLAEWIEYHLHVGVQHFWLYTLHHDDAWLDILEPYLAQDIISVDYQYAKYPRYIQPLTYEHCFAEHYLSSRWIAFLDIDEFLVVSPTSEFSTMPSLLNTLEQSALKRSTQLAGIGLNWRTFGTSGHTARPNGLQTASYTQHVPWPLPQESPAYSGGLFAAKTDMKPILNTQAVSTSLLSFWAREGTYNHNPLGSIWLRLDSAGSDSICRPHSFFFPMVIRPEILASYTREWPSRVLRDAKLQPINNPWYLLPHGPDYSFAWINHYFTRSTAEWRKQSKNLDFVTGFYRANPNLPMNGSLGYLPTPGRLSENVTHWILERRDPHFPNTFDRYCTAEDRHLTLLAPTLERAIADRKASGQLPSSTLNQLRAGSVDDILQWTRARHTQHLLDIISYHYGTEERGGLAYICASLQQVRQAKYVQPGTVGFHVLSIEIDFASEFIDRCAQQASTVFVYPSTLTPWYLRAVLPNSEIDAFDSVHPFDWDVWNNRYVHLPPSIVEFPYWDVIVLNPLPYGWESVHVIVQFITRVILQFPPHFSSHIYIRNRPGAALPSVTELQTSLPSFHIFNFVQTHNVLHFQISAKNQQPVMHASQHHLDSSSVDPTDEKQSDDDATNPPLPAQIGVGNSALIGICACIDATEERFVVEWIEYHRQLGVNLFFLYTADLTAASLSVLYPYVEEGLVLLHQLETERLAQPLDAQMRAFASCLSMYRFDVQWLAFIDLEDYLSVPTPHSLMAYLEGKHHLLAVRMPETIMSPNLAPDSAEFARFDYFFLKHSLRLTTHADASKEGQRFKTILHTGHSKFSDAISVIEFATFSDQYNPFSAAPWLSGIEAGGLSVSSTNLTSAHVDDNTLSYFHYDTWGCQNADHVIALQSSWQEMMDRRVLKSTPQYCHLQSKARTSEAFTATRRASRVFESIMLRGLFRPALAKSKMMEKINGEFSNSARFSRFPSMQAKLQIQKFIGSSPKSILSLGTDFLTEFIISLNLNGSTRIVALDEDPSAWISSHRRASGSLLQFARKSLQDDSTPCWQLPDDILERSYDLIFCHEQAKRQISFCSLPHHSLFIPTHPILEQIPLSLEESRYGPAFPLIAGIQAYTTKQVMVVVDIFSPSDDHLICLVNSLMALGHRIHLLFRELDESASASAFSHWRSLVGSRVDHYSQLRKDRPSSYSKDGRRPSYSKDDHPEAAYLLGLPLKSYAQLLRLAAGVAAENRFSSELASSLFEVDFIFPMITAESLTSELFLPLVYQIKVQHYFRNSQLIPIVLNDRLNLTTSWCRPPLIDMLYRVDPPEHASLLETVNVATIHDIDLRDAKSLQSAMEHTMVLARSSVEATAPHDFSYQDDSTNQCSLQMTDPRDVPSDLSIHDWILGHLRLELVLADAPALINVRMIGFPPVVLTVSQLLTSPDDSGDVFYLALDDLFVQTIKQLRPDQSLEICAEIVGSRLDTLSHCCFTSSHLAHRLSPFSSEETPPIQSPEISEDDIESLNKLIQTWNSTRIHFHLMGFQHWANNSNPTRAFPIILRNKNDFLKVVSIEPQLESLIHRYYHPTNQSNWHSFALTLRSAEESIMLLNPSIWWKQVELHTNASHSIDYLSPSPLQLHVDGAVGFQNQDLLWYELDHIYTYGLVSGHSQDRQTQLALSSPFVILDQETPFIPAFNFSFAILVRSLRKDLEGTRYILPRASAEDADIYEHDHIPGSDSPIPLSLTVMSKFYPSCAHLIWAAREFGVQLFTAPSSQIPLITLSVTLSLERDVQIQTPNPIECPFPWKSLRLVDSNSI